MQTHGTNPAAGTAGRLRPAARKVAIAAVAVLTAALAVAPASGLAQGASNRAAATGQARPEASGAASSFITPGSGSVMVTSGRSRTFRVGVRSFPSGTARMRYHISASGSVALSRRSGTVTLDHAVSASVPIRVLPRYKGNFTLVIRTQIVGSSSRPRTLTLTIVRTSAPETFSHAFNNAGIGSDGTGANMDGAGYAYSSQALAAAGITPGATINGGGATFIWPSVAAGRPDNVEPQGQLIRLPKGSTGTTLGFLGSSTDGPVSDTVVIQYQGGGSQVVTLDLSDWALGGGGSSPQPGNVEVADTSYRDSGTTTQTLDTYLFAQSFQLKSSRPIKDIVLPWQSNLHLFAVGLGQGTLAQAYDNRGVSSDGVATGANFDGGGYAYSSQALASLGIKPGSTVAAGGVMFTWPSAAPGQADNVQAAGQQIVLPDAGSAQTIGFLGSATNGPISGSVTIDYRDGTSQTVDLTFSDWTLNAGSSSPASGDDEVAKMSYRDGGSSTQSVGTYLFAQTFALDDTSPIENIVLPDNSSLHIFDIATG